MTMLAPPLPKPLLINVVSAVGHGTLAVAVSGCNTAVENPAAAPSIAGGADTVAEATGGASTSTGGSMRTVRAVTDCSIVCISVSIQYVRSKRRRTLASHWERLLVVAVKWVRPRTDDARPRDAGRPCDAG